MPRRAHAMLGQGSRTKVLGEVGSLGCGREEECKG